MPKSAPAGRGDLLLFSVVLPFPYTSSRNLPIRSIASAVLVGLASASGEFLLPPKRHPGLPFPLPDWLFYRAGLTRLLESKTSSAPNPVLCQSWGTADSLQYQLAIAQTATPAPPAVCLESRSLAHLDVHLNRYCQRTKLGKLPFDYRWLRR